MKSMKSVYNLDYDSSGFNSNLLHWYNRMIDKSYSDLDVIDVSKMIRQDILKKVALKKALDLFIKNPYIGEYRDGDLLNTIVTNNVKIFDNTKKKYLLDILNQLELNYHNYEWSNEEDKNLFFDNIKKFIAHLEM